MAAPGRDAWQHLDSRERLTMEKDKQKLSLDYAMARARKHTLAVETGKLGAEHEKRAIDKAMLFEVAAQSVALETIAKQLSKQKAGFP